VKLKRFIKSVTFAKKPLKFKVYNRLIADHPTDPCVGHCWPWKKKRKIEIDPRQSPKDYLDTLIHEMLHELFPQKPEKNILHSATSIANCLWRLNYRRLKFKRKKKR
jgi:hypothetical protein